MSGPEIRNIIDKNNDKILDLLRKNNFNFVFDPEIGAILAENEGLRKQCEHEYENGKCKYCDLEEKINNFSME